MQIDRDTWAKLTDRRKCRRYRTNLNGKLFIPAHAREVPCVVLELSARGAGVRCGKAPPPRTKVVLYVDGFGRFDGMTTQPTKGGTGIRFECTDRKRQRLADQLEWYARPTAAAAPPRV